MTKNESIFPYYTRLQKKKMQFTLKKSEAFIKEI